MSKPAKRKRGPGRPPKALAEKYIRALITLPPELDEFARKLGDGDRSKGVQSALLSAQEKEK